MKKIGDLFKFGDDFFLSISIVNVFAQHLFIMLKVSSVSSYLYTILFITVGFWFLFSVVNLFCTKKNSSKNYISYFQKKICLFLVLAICFFSTTSVLVDQFLQTNRLLLTFEYYKKLIIFLEVIAFIFSCYSGTFSKIPLRVLRISALIFSLLVLFLFIKGSVRTWYGFKQWHMLTLNFHNPNACGLVLSVLSSILFYSCLSSKTKLFRIIYLSLFLIMVFFLFLTECRNAFIALGLFFVTMAFCKFIKKNSLVLSTVTILFPLIFASLYLLYFIILNNGAYHTGSSVGVVGKNDSTRYSIWINAIHNINFNPFVGSYFVSSGGSGQFQWHNTEIDLVAGFGFATLFLTIILLIFVVYSLFSNFKNRRTVVSFGMFCLIISLGTFEGFPFYSANALALLSISFIPICLDSYSPISVNEGVYSVSKCDLLLIGNNNSTVLCSYHKYLNDLGVGTIFLKETEYMTLSKKSTSFIAKGAQVFDYLSCLRLALEIKNIKPKVVEIFPGINMRALTDIIRLCFRRSTIGFIIYTDGEIPFTTKNNKQLNHVIIKTFVADTNIEEKALFKQHLYAILGVNPVISNSFVFYNINI